MRQKTLRLIVTFHTTAEAMATEHLCRRKSLAGKLISVPRQLTSDCGLAWSAPLELQDILKHELEEACIETAGFHQLPV